MAAVGCLEKEIQFQKEAIKEQDARQAQDMPLTKNIRIQLKTFLFPKKSRDKYVGLPVTACSQYGHPRLSDRVPSSPGCTFLLKGASAMPTACLCSLPCPSSGRAATVPAHPPLLPTRKALGGIPPFPVTGQKPFPQAEDGDLPSTPEKSFTGRGGPGEGDAFSKAPFSPGKPPKLPLQKTRLPLPHPRRHLPGRARPGAHRPRRGQASATARAGAP